ncbi:hypothetical protein HJG60_011567 [Phyllostomus discolor]|uniref:Uncharacterized protein n=1 Tax=Phyllostomus discolor TaxID=89673 RepID=A0A834E0W4_9CHIR|nr:hypothetical protein HJG60_011567 [Phyllostomus discolor]
MKSDGGLKSWKLFRFKPLVVSLVINASKSYCFQELKVTQPGSRRPQGVLPLCPRWDCKPPRRCLSRCVPGRDLHAQDTDGNHQSRLKECCGFYLINFPPEFQTPHLHFSSPCKKGRFDMKYKTVF